ncbi:MAG: ATP synthase F1 subunit delta [Candidatus Magasanikbacteria bacterium CG_4_9_14_3_um_filter_32_9]|uniref:ATP synthase subunit delta n=1 Tax=Candidatus Magasanikbacteria bacterium CG_4_9_14_3_um_filter_32_9 TaxID=1974644 RepID=A0A2M7Z778_9BACT|nr:MAG: ATP synthase F1 subunit delta [Candidatus Magasanikbacteria bacterium CG_4_9_14_3_um_filter_32_9]
MKKALIKDYSKALYDMTTGIEDSQVDTVIGSFIELLARDGKITKVDKIIEEYTKYEKLQRGVKEVEITSAFDVSEKVAKEVKNYFGGEVEITKKIDKGILGGLRIKLGDTIFDTSVKTQLAKMKESLI